MHQNGPDISYKIYTRGGILKNSFQSEDFLGTQNVHFHLLQDVDIHTLEEITFIKLPYRRQAGPPKELQCADARENV